MSRFGVVLLGVAVALGVVTDAPSAESGRRVISVLAKASSESYTDAPPKGQLSAGDVAVGTDTLRNARAQFGKPKGALVGRDRFRIVLTGPRAARVSLVATLPGGTISCGGNASPSSQRLVLRVTRGTGVFTGATGTCESRPGPGRQTLHTYRFRVP